jgi:hypothetical protein
MLNAESYFRNIIECPEEVADTVQNVQKLGCTVSTVYNVESRLCGLEEDSYPLPYTGIARLLS